MTLTRVYRMRRAHKKGPAKWMQVSALLCIAMYPDELAREWYPYWRADYGPKKFAQFSGLDKDT